MPRPNQGPKLKFLEKRGRYYITWSENGRSHERSAGTSDREEAQIKLAEFIQERRRSQVTGPRDPSRFSIAEALADYAEEHGPETTSPERIGYAIDALLGFWKDNLVIDVSEATCSAYLRYRNRSIGTMRRELTVLRAAINHELKRGRLTRAPSVWLPERPEGKSRWLTRQETASLLRAAKAEKKVRLYLPLFILLGLYTGARKGAILDLRWTQVDLERQVIDLNPSGRKRTSKRRPIIPIPRRLLTFLREARKRGSDLGYVVHHNGRRIGDIKKGFARAAQDAGLQDVTPHTLRHTCGTWLAQKGVPLWQIGGWLGHSTERTVELYAHHHPDHLAAARKAMGG